MTKGQRWKERQKEGVGWRGKKTDGNLERGTEREREIQTETWK